MILSVTKKEVLLLREAAYLLEGFLDYENYTDEQFEKRYGFTKDESYSMETSLRCKIDRLKNKIKP